jgi:hypothetical protein
VANLRLRPEHPTDTALTRCRQLDHVHRAANDSDRPFADPEIAARKLLEIANATEAAQDGRIYIEKINGQFLFKEGGTPEDYKAGLHFAIDRGWLWKHESGTYVKFTPAGADLFA